MATRKSHLHMKCGMCFLTHELKVLDSIIKFIAVFMMYDFFRKLLQFTTNILLHNMDMFKMVSTVNCDTSISFDNAAFTRSIASFKCCIPMTFVSSVVHWTHVVFAAVTPVSGVFTVFNYAKFNDGLLVTVKKCYRWVSMLVPAPIVHPTPSTFLRDLTTSFDRALFHQFNYIISTPVIKELAALKNLGLLAA